jgi:hypothetical protein
MMSRWIVPQDNMRTMFIELRHVSETAGATSAWWADRGVMLPGQLPAADSYEASQLRPGDYEAQVGQRAVAVHELEHLGATDRGVIMFRQQVRRGIRAVQEGQDPQGLFATPAPSSRPTATTPSWRCRRRPPPTRTARSCGGRDGRSPRRI